MPLISIDGVALPTPSDYSVGVMDISKAERNAKGNMIIERITTKKKISLKYSVVNANTLKELLTKLSPTFFNVTYLDPVSNLQKTSSFYCGDRKVDMISFIDDVPVYKDISFDLIER